MQVQDIVGDLDARTSGGPIRVERVSGTVNATTSGGAIHVAAIGGHVRASTSGGPISIDATRGDVEVRTSGGVSAAVDPAAALSIDASTSGGRVSSDLALTVRSGLGRNAVRGDLNGGGSTLRLRTSGGPIRISAATGSGL